VFKAAPKTARAALDRELPELANLAWSLAKQQSKDRPLMEAIADEMLSMRWKQDSDPQQVSDFAWAFAKVGFRDARLNEALAAAAQQLSAEKVKAQHVASTVWAFAKLKISDRRVLERLSPSSHMSEF